MGAGAAISSNLNDFTTGGGTFNPMTGQPTNPVTQPYQNLSTPTAGASGVATDPNLYKNPNSPYNGMVWNESTGWQSPTSTMPGAMPSDNTMTGGLSSALGTTSTAAPTPTSNYNTTGAPTPMPIMASNTPPQGDSNTATLGTGQTASPFMGSTNPYIQAAQATTMGNLYGAQAATQANRINQNTPYGSLNYTRSIDQYGNPVWTANQQLSQPLQNLTNTSLQGLQQSLQNPLYGINPGQTYSEAIMQRLQPQIAQQRESMASDLANQGIVPGTKAYENAMRTFNQQQNDLLTSAQIQGMQTGLSAQQLQNQQAANIKALSNPNYINPYTQAAVAGPDYLGAYTTSRAADIAAQNAANAKAANLQNGLFGLGSSALLGAGGIGSTGTNGTGGTGLLGLGSSAYNTLFGNTGMDLLNNAKSSQDYMNMIGATPSSMYDQAMSSNDYLNNLYRGMEIF